MLRKTMITGWVNRQRLHLAQYASEKNYERATLEKKFPRIGELPFDSKRKIMTTFHQTETGVVAIVKGAVDVLLDKLQDQSERNGSRIRKQGK